MSCYVEFNRYVLKYGDKFYGFSKGTDNNVRDWNGRLSPSWSRFNNDWFGITEDKIDELVERQGELADSGSVQQPIFDTDYKGRDAENYKKIWKRTFNTAKEMTKEDYNKVMNDDYEEVVEKHIREDKNKPKTKKAPKWTKDLKINDVKRCDFRGVEKSSRWNSREFFMIRIDVGLEWKGEEYDTGFIVKLDKEGIEMSKCSYFTKIKRILNNREEEIKEKFLQTEEGQEVVKKLKEENEKQKKIHKKNKPKIKEIVKYSEGDLEFKLKGYADVIFCYNFITKGIDCMRSGQTLIQDAEEKKGYKAYIGWTDEVLEGLKQHPKLRLPILTGEISLGGDE